MDGKVSAERNRKDAARDGWTGAKMAIFCEALAETAVAAEACDAAGMGISGAYAARRERAEDEALPDEWFALLREEAAEPSLPTKEGQGVGASASEPC